MPLPEQEMSNSKKVKVHDYSCQTWGWTYNFIDGGKDWFCAIGWGEGLKVGDQIVTVLRKTVRIRYWIREIKYKRDPQDMWEALFERVDEPDNPQEPN